MTGDVRWVHGRKLFTRPRTDADATLHVAADADSSFWGRQLRDATGVWTYSDDTAKAVPVLQVVTVLSVKCRTTFEA